MNKIKYDVVIVGGGTSGIACSYMCGKLGLKTLVVEKTDTLGGTITQGLVIPCMQTHSEHLNEDFFADLLEFSAKYSANIMYSDGNSGWFNPELLKIVLDDMLNTYNVDTLFSTRVANVIRDNTNNNFNITISNGILSIDIEANYLVDATGNGEIFKLLNLDFQNKNKFSQAASLRFILGNVNLLEFEKWILDLDSDRDVTTSAHINGQIHLSTAYTWDLNKSYALKPIFTKAISNKILTEEDTAYFQLFTVANMPNSVAFNCPRIMINDNEDINDPFIYSNALKSGRQKIYRYYNFAKLFLKGFENSYISNIASILGVRESNRVLGKYTYTIDDLKTSKSFEHNILECDYPVDIHKNSVSNSGLQNFNKYYLPVEALISKNYDNLFSIGRCLSADFKSQSALRTQKSCFSMGEAVAKYIKNKLS